MILQLILSSVSLFLLGFPKHIIAAVVLNKSSTDFFSVKKSTLVHHLIFIFSIFSCLSHLIIVREKISFIKILFLLDYRKLKFLMNVNIRWHLLLLFELLILLRSIRTTESESFDFNHFKHDHIADGHLKICDIRHYTRYFIRVKVNHSFKLLVFRV